MISIQSNEFSKWAGKIPVVDVRSPGEFLKGHITDAVNIPLFDNEERATIGKLYIQSGRSDAIEKGLEIVGPKLYTLVKEAKMIAKENRLAVYCWRGGMRSEKIAWLFETAGIESMVIRGGYKAYRNQLSEDFLLIKDLVVIHGPTGCGKTEILSELEKRGEQVIDLEYHARHRGSAFGSIGLEPQPSTMQFQNDIHRRMIGLDITKRVWVEGESINIGKVYLPDSLWKVMNNALVLNLNLAQKSRVIRIVNEYGQFPKEILCESIKKIEKRFGGDQTKKAVKLVEDNQLEQAVEMLLDYYDKNYHYSLKKYREGKIIEVITESVEASENADLLLRTIKEIN